MCLPFMNVDKIQYKGNLIASRNVFTDLLAGQKIFLCFVSIFCNILYRKFGVEKITSAKFNWVSSHCRSAQKTSQGYPKDIAISLEYPYGIFWVFLRDYIYSLFICFSLQNRKTRSTPYSSLATFMLLSLITYSRWFPTVRLKILCDRDSEWWWDPSIIHHIYRWPRFGCWRSRGSSREKIAARHGCCPNRTTQALSLPFTRYHQLQAASWRGSLQSRGENSCNQSITSKIIFVTTSVARYQGRRYSTNMEYICLNLIK